MMHVPSPCADEYHILSFTVHADIVKASSGPRYVVGCRSKIDKSKLNSGARVALDMTTLTIMRALPREVDLLPLEISRPGLTHRSTFQLAVHNGLPDVARLQPALLIALHLMDVC